MVIPLYLKGASKQKGALLSCTVCMCEMHYNAYDFLHQHINLMYTSRAMKWINVKYFFLNDINSLYKLCIIIIIM